MNSTPLSHHAPPFRISLQAWAPGAPGRKIQKGGACFDEFLPARLGHAGNLAGECQIPETDATELEFPQISSRTAAAPAAV